MSGPILQKENWDSKVVKKKIQFDLKEIKRNPYGSIRDKMSKKWVKGQEIHAPKMAVSALGCSFHLQLKKHPLGGASLTMLQRVLRIKICRHSFQSKYLS